MSGRFLKRLQRSLVVLAALATVPAAPTQAQSLSCFGPKQFTVCRCISCTYVVACKLQVGLPASFILYDLCTGTNPGFVVMSSAPALTGLSSQSTSYGFGCGTASIVGACCGGTRTTTMDASIYTVMVPSGLNCGPAGTSGSGV